MNPIEQYISKQQEPFQSIMVYVRSVILKSHDEVYEKLSYGIPFFYSKKKPLCYLNILKGKNYLDVAFVHGIHLEKDFAELRNDHDRKQVRSLPLKSLEDLDEHRFKLLLFAAIDDIKRRGKS